VLLVDGLDELERLPDPLPEVAVVDLERADVVTLLQRLLARAPAVGVVGLTSPQAGAERVAAVAVDLVTAPVGTRGAQLLELIRGLPRPAGA
jgi:hypothetical protein